MTMSQDDFSIESSTYREVYIILNKLGLYNRIPGKMREYIEKNQDIKHEFTFNDKAPLFYQIESEQTKNFLTFLFIKYINTSKNDAEKTKKDMLEIMKGTNS